MNLSPLELFHENLGLAKRMVSLMGGYQLARRCGLDLDDLHQIAQMALWHAAQRFDPTRGFQFSTYACNCIRGQLITGPQHYRYGGSPEWDCNFDHVTKLIGNPCYPDGTPMDFPNQENVFEEVRTEEIRSSVHRSLGELKLKRGADVVRAHALQGKKFVDIARESGISRERVRQTFNDAIGKLKADQRLAALAAE